MAVKVFCNICEKFIKNAEQFEFQKLTGKEMCETCGGRVNDLFQVLDDSIKDYNNRVDAMVANVKKKYAMLDKAYNKFNSDAIGLHTTKKAEIESHLKNILEGDKKK